MIAGDADQIYVVVEDNRGNLYTNYTTSFNIGNRTVHVVGDDKEDTPFEQYGYELVFDSLDPDSLLVDPDGAVESYKKTNSFAVVSYTNSNDEREIVHEIGVMCIEVKAPRKLDYVKFENTSFTLLAETEAEDGNANYYANNNAFKLEGTTTVTFMNQYGEAWGSNAEDWLEPDTEFVVTTSKDDFDGIAEELENALNAGTTGGSYTFHSSMFEGTNTTSVSFKVKELYTGDSKTITVKLDKPKYNEDETVYVDPTRAILEVDTKDLYVNTSTDAKLFQVSKASQKVGFFRPGTLEFNDEGHNYYVGNTLSKKFTSANEGFASYASGSAMVAASSSSLIVGDYILVVTDPKGNVVPALGVGYGKNNDENIGITATETGYKLILAYANDDNEMVYAETGTYTATVYKISNISSTSTITKFVTSRVDSYKFNVSKTTPVITFFHQKTTKDVESVSAFDANDMTTIIPAIAETMTFKITGLTGEFIIDETGCAQYKSLVKYNDGETNDYHSLNIEVAAVDFKVQNNGQRAVVNTVTFKVYTPAGGYFLTKVKVNRSINIAD